MKALLDTNVIVDALQDRQPWAESARALFRAAARDRFRGCITAKACTDIHYLTRRNAHSEKLARDTLSKLFALFELLDTSADDCKRALLSNTSDFEDAIEIETSIREGVDCIVTRNIGDFKFSPIKVMEPDAFLTMLDEAE